MFQLTHFTLESSWLSDPVDPNKGGVPDRVEHVRHDPRPLLWLLQSVGALKIGFGKTLTLANLVDQTGRQILKTYIDFGWANFIYSGHVWNMYETMKGYCLKDVAVLLEGIIT